MSSLKEDVIFLWVINSFIVEVIRAGIRSERVRLQKDRSE